MADKPEILVIDSDRQVVESLSSFFKAKGYIPFGIYTGQKGLELALNDVFELIILDSALPDISSHELIRRIKGLKVSAPIVVISSPENMEQAIDLSQSGAVSILTKPLNNDLLLHAVRSGINQLHLERDIQKLRNSLSDQFEILGHSEVIEQFRGKLKRIASSNSRALFYGEPGSGKRDAAKYIHYSSSRAVGPFHEINCALASKGTSDDKHKLECDLFGFERDAFVGANRSTKGRFELAEGGTIYLNEIGGLTSDLQAKLLRAIESSHITRIGGAQEIKVNVRLLASSTINLEAEVKAGRFREDLYFRMNVIPVTVPPLREYQSDIPFISRYILESAGFLRKHIDRDALVYMKQYDWPGNHRQLNNVLLTAARMSYGEIINLDQIKAAIEGEIVLPSQRPPAMPSTPPQQTVSSEALYNSALNYREHIIEYEKSLLVEILNACDFNITQAAKMLQTDRGNLSKRIKKLGLKDTK